MPAEDFHVLKAKNALNGVWFPLPETDSAGVATPLGTNHSENKMLGDSRPINDAAICSIEALDATQLTQCYRTQPRPNADLFRKKYRVAQVRRITSDIRDGSSSNLGQDMQIQSMRTRYSAVLKQIHGIERPGHSLNTGNESSSADSPTTEKLSRNTSLNPHDIGRLCIKHE